MNKLLDQFNKSQIKELPDIKPGDTIRVHQKISAESGSASGGKEKKGERIQIFEGVVIARKHGKGISSTITVRKVVDGVGVEKIFPLHSPAVEKFEVIKRGKVRRAKLYYLRTAKGKKARLKNKEFATAIAEPDQNPADIETGEEPAEETSPEEDGGKEIKNEEADSKQTPVENEKK